MIRGIKGIYFRVEAGVAQVSPILEDVEISQERGEVVLPQRVPIEGLRVGREQSGCSPVIEGVLLTAIEAARLGEARRAPGTNGSRRKCVERLAAISATPQCAGRGRSLAAGTSEFLPPWQLGDAQKFLGVLEPAPAI